MNYILVSTNPTLEALFTRVIPEVPFCTFNSISSLPQDLNQQITTLIVDEPTISLMQLLDAPTDFGKYAKIIILTEKRSELISNFENSTIVSYPLTADEIRDHITHVGKISA
ncbi:hypothetical protein [Corynebacterium cystitidis]|uniref:Uncharacterized protein n=1 Tax=Corynebacterium cystitidis DSM 20524 TaxID=1121357 RepID=A0A1H9TRQ7_9CORY|nr:hypothetical protein [Corynebacterium cystitidis]WJY81985.1 hypothetical protein CCYS_05210 [Corynebacterium cystitidis DSM 20524]SER99687.1 hypothetical protein SAMN05661109_01521 [Corynebacterium cystitidis DSM 20524]SNV81224.1 Uncharacterised protein [Corynebacterium cystitidis]